MNEELAQLQTGQQQISNSVAEEVEDLREKLAHVQERAENLRAPGTIDPFDDALAEESSQAVAEQVKLRVEAIRAELEARHDERVNQLEETYKKRTDNMRNQLTKKLAEGKDQMRQALAAEHDQTLDALRSAHRQKLDQLEKRHQDEIAELRRNEESKFAQFKETWLKEHHIAAVPSEERAVTLENPTPTSPWKPTEAEAREFVSTNATVRSILRNNISTKVKEAKDALSVELKEEHEKLTAQRLKEIQDKADLAKEHAVYTEGKRFALKLNLADNRSKVAQAKLEVVQKAAQETPEKPIGEVWAIAKDAKPPAQLSAPTAQNVSRGGTFGQPTPLGPRSIQPQPNAQPMTPGLTASTETQGTLQQKADPEIANISNQPQASQLPITTPAMTSTEGLTPFAQPANIQTGLQSNLPVKLQSNNAQPQPGSGSGSGSGTVRGLQQSGLPIARGGLSRGTSHPRGRGQELGRGGGQAPDAIKGQGNKRTRDDSQDGQHGISEGNGKRIRGGSIGS